MNSSPVEKSRRILVIDDNRAIHEDFRKILSPATASTDALDFTESALFGSPLANIPQTHFEVDSAYQGKEGVLLVRTALEAGLPYAMAFVDVRMPPGWDGVETALRAWELDASLQVVLCTAYSDCSWAEMFARLGHRDGLLILKKPFDAVEALQMAHALTEKSWLHHQFQRKIEELESRVAERTCQLEATNDTLLQKAVQHQRAEESLRLLGAAVEQATESILITERKRSESARQESELRFRTYFELGLLGMALTSPTKRWIEVNDKICQMLGYERDELLQMTWEELTHPADFALDLANFENVTAGKVDGYSMDKRFVRKDGQVIETTISVKCVRRADASVDYFMVLMQDITERKRLEARLFESQKLETVGRLAGGIAHEFNSILTAIIGQSDILLGDLPSGSPQAKSAIEISKAASRATTLTRQLLAYGRRQFLQPETLDLNRVIAGMEGIFDHLMGGDVDTQIVLGPDMHAVKADGGQIEHVILNMAMNAADAMPKGGKLTLETANVTLAQDYVSRFPELKAGDYVMLAITDTGIGMSEEVMARVFEPFFSTKGVGQGTGLGLSTCYGIIKQSGGHISVYSEPFRGTTFKIYLPQVEHGAMNPAQRHDPAEIPRGTETILLVEDDPALREMAGTLLRRLGYTVLAAANGIEALTLHQQSTVGPIDLLFTDVVMPQMSGKELSECVQASSPQTKILFTSAYTENAILHQGLLSKGVELLQKPFTPSALAHKLRQVLDQSSAPKSQ